jgi:hypothetical protein
MALALNNRVRETTATTGTGAVTLAGAVDGFQTFAAGIGNSNTTYYAISLNTANEWEVGLGTLNGDSSTLTRTTVLESSNSDSAVDFAAGSKEIFCTLPSEKAVYLDASDNQVGGFSSLAADTTPQLGGDLDVNGNAIVSASNGAIAINANGTGKVTMTTNSVTGDVIPGKFGGTDFSNSILIGHSTTGTLDAADQNIGIGTNALDALTTADYNIAIGYNAGTKLTTGGYNTYIGGISGRETVGGVQNVGIGYASSVDTTGDYNTALGSLAGTNVSSGDWNICLGRDAGQNITTGSGNIIIGDVDATAADSARTLKIVSYDGSTTTNHMIGDSSGNQIFAGTATAAGGQLTTTGKALVMGF